MTSPFLQDLCKRTGLAESEIAPRWQEALRSRAAEKGGGVECLESEDYDAISDAVYEDIIRGEEVDPALDPASFVESSLDAEAYLETKFVHSGPEGSTEVDDKKTHLVTSPEAGLLAAGLMSPAPSGAAPMGEAADDTSQESLDDLAATAAAAAADLVEGLES